MKSVTSLLVIHKRKKTIRIIIQRSLYTMETSFGRNLKCLSIFYSLVFFVPEGTQKNMIPSD